MDKRQDLIEYVFANFLGKEGEGTEGWGRGCLGGKEGEKAF